MSPNRLPSIRPLLENCFRETKTQLSFRKLFTRGQRKECAMRIIPYSRNVLHIGLVGLVVMALTGLLGVNKAVADNALPVAKAQVQETYGKLPLYFEANQGQTDRQVKFLSRGAHHTLFLTSDEAVLVFTKPEPSVKGKPAKVKPEQRAKATQAVLRMSFVGANPKTRVEGLEELPGKANYFIGNDPKKWRPNVPIYARVQYRDLYPGINLIYYGNLRQLEYDFVVRPGVDPEQIKLAFQGAEDVKI